MRESLSAEERLVVTLWVLASGDAQQSLNYSFRIGKATLSHIIAETSEMIHKCLKDEFLRAPKTQEEWEKVAESFEEFWNMPNAIGSIDGKRIRIQCPQLFGTQFYNFKWLFAMLITASLCSIWASLEAIIIVEF